ncbi:MAG TPA: hypothetical protein DCS05_08050 [Nitrospiraceae bacterium]|nr:hypothetical protein [Nitrospiraceae bacterium]
MKTILSIEQCKVLMNHMKNADQALFLSLLLCGAEARTWTWEAALEKVLDLPTAVYEALRALAMERQLALFPSSFAGFTQAHWVRQETKLQTPIFKASLPLSSSRTSSPQVRNALRSQALTTQEVTRRMKRYARLAGLEENQMNLRTALNTHRWLLKSYGSAESASDAIGPVTRDPAKRPTRVATITVSWKPISTSTAGLPSSRDLRLHGIGRRNRRASIPA